MSLLEEEEDKSALFLNEKSLPLDWEASVKSLLNVSATSDDTLTEKRGEFKKVPQAACASMPDLSQVAPSSNRSLSSAGRSTPTSIRPMSLREYEQQLSDLKKENFNLKLRIYFLESKLPKIKSLAGEDLLKVNLDLQVTIEKQTQDLETQGALLKKTRDNLQQIQKHNEIQVENLKRDHQFCVQQLELRISNSNEALKTLTPDLNDNAERLQKLEMENKHLREDLTAAHGKLVLMETSDSDEGNSSISLLDEKEREILDLKGRLANSEYDRRQKEEELEQMKEVFDKRTNFIEQETPVKAEMTGIEAGSLIVAPETEELIASLEDQLAEKEKKLAELKCSFSREAANCAEAVNEREELKKKVEELEDQLRVSEENAFKRDKSIQGLVKLLDRTNGYRLERTGKREEQTVAAAASFMFCETLTEITSASDLMNKSLNTSQDLGNLRKRLCDLKKVCDRLYNKLKGSFKFLKKLLVQLGGAELAKKFEDEFGALQIELEESLNATGAIFEECKNAEDSIGIFVSELQVVSRRLSEIPQQTEKDLSALRFLDMSVGQNPSPKVVDAAFNTSLTAKDLQEWEKRLMSGDATNAMLGEAVKNAQVACAQTKTDFLDLQKEFQEVMASRSKHDRCVGSDLGLIDLEEMENKCSKLEQYLTAVRERLERFKKEVKVDGLTCTFPKGGDESGNQSMEFDEIFDILAETVRQEREKQNETIQNLRKDCENLEMKQKEWEKRLSSADATNMALKDAVKKARVACAKTKADFSDLQKEFAVVTASRSTLDRCVGSDLRLSDLEKMERKCGKFEQYLRAATERVEKFQQEIKPDNAAFPETVDESGSQGMKFDEIFDSLAENIRQERKKQNETIRNLWKKCENFEMKQKEWEKRLVSADTTNAMLDEAVKNAQAACAKTKRDFLDLQKEFEVVMASRSKRDQCVGSDMRLTDLEKIEKKCGKLEQYLKAVRERLEQFQKEIEVDGLAFSERADESGNQSMKLHEVFDYLAEIIRQEREKQNETVQSLSKECENLEIKGKEWEKRLMSADSTNAMLDEAVKNAQAACAKTKRDFLDLQKEFEAVMASRSKRDQCVGSDMGLRDLEKIEKKCGKFEQYLRAVKERLEKFQKEIKVDGSAFTEGSDESGNQSMKFDEIFDSLAESIRKEREKQNETIENLKKECERLDVRQKVKSTDLESIIRQLNENNEKLEQRLKDADHALQNAKENVSPSDGQDTSQTILKEVGELRQENARLQDQLVRTLEMLTSTQERLTVKSVMTQEAQDGICRELAKIRQVLKQSKQDLVGQQKQRKGRSFSTTGKQ